MRRAEVSHTAPHASDHPSIVHASRGAVHPRGRGAQEASAASRGRSLRLCGARTQASGCQPPLQSVPRERSRVSSRLSRPLAPRPSPLTRLSAASKGRAASAASAAVMPQGARWQAQSLARAPRKREGWPSDAIPIAMKRGKPRRLDTFLPAGRRRGAGPQQAAATPGQRASGANAGAAGEGGRRRAKERRARKARGPETAGMNRVREGYGDPRGPDPPGARGHGAAGRTARSARTMV